MVFNVITFMMKKIGFRLVVLLGFSFALLGCNTWPSFVIGDSSGYISYDRNTRKLEVLWEKHVQLQDSTKQASLVDSIQGNK